MTAAQRVNQFWPFWIVRVTWLLALWALTWPAGEGVLRSSLLGAVGAALLIQGVLFLLARFRRLPRWDDWLAAVVAAGLASLALVALPEADILVPLLGLVPFLDLARRRGWASLLLLLLFPGLAFGYAAVTGGEWLPELSLWLPWGFTLLLGCALAGASVAPPAAVGTLAEALAESPEGILAKVAQLLASETNYERIMDALVRGGAEVLNSGAARGRSRARAMALTFRPGLSDVLVVTSLHNMDLKTERSYELSGVLATLLNDGEPIETDARQPPFNNVKSLEGHRLLLFPLRTGIDVYGAVLFATLDATRASDETVQRTLIALADQASLALHNAVLQQELRRDRDERLGGDEEARHQLARDLHDGPVQRVAAISMQLEFIKALMKRQPERAVAELEQLQQVAKQASQEMRTMLFTLRPVVLESEGLTAALEALVKRLREQDKLAITLEADPMPRLDAKVEDVAFAILQEAIGNAKKYANGAPIRVRLIKGHSMVVGQVEDEGPGFDLKAVTSSYGTRASLGLLNMQERASMVGGQLKIDTAPGKGTVISVAVPISRS